MDVVQAISDAFARISSETRVKARRAWQAFNLGVLSLNSFIMLQYATTVRGLAYTVSAAAIGYVVVLLIQSIVLRKRPDKIESMLITRKVFRLLYTALYLTSIMLQVIAASGTADPVGTYRYCGVAFFWVLIWGTNVLWGRPVWGFVKRRFLTSDLRGEA